MSRIRPIIAGAVIAAAGLLSINGIAYAATGHSLILGHRNSESNITTISNSGHNPAIYLKTHGNEAPLKVTSSQQVAKLNASKVGGYKAGALQTHAYRYVLPTNSPSSSSTTFSLPGLPAGTYQASFDVVGDMSASGDLVNCVVEAPSSTSYQLLAYGAPFGGYSTASASGVVNVSNAGLQLRCFTNSGTFSTDDTGAISSASFVKIDSLTNGTSTPSTAHRLTRSHVRSAGR